MNNAKNKGSFGRKTSIREMFAVVFVFVFFFTCNCPTFQKWDKTSRFRRPN